MTQNNTLKCSDIDISNISYVPDKKYTKILYDNNELIIQTDYVYTPFGLEKEYNNFYVKIVENDESECLFSKVREIEKENVEYIQRSTECDIVNYNSQIFSRKDYKDFLKLKLPMKCGQFMTNVYNRQGDIKTVYDISPKTKLKITFEIDTIWLFRDKYSSVFKIKNITLDK